MTSPPSRTPYHKRLHTVLHYIDAHLLEPLELPMLARVAHFSPFHFHRLFQSWTGETCGAYVRRRRVEMAAARMAAAPALSVFEAALAVGFGSGEAFSRAFRARFGAAPSAWRRRHARQHQLDRQMRNPGQEDGTAVQENPRDKLLNEEVAMAIVLVQRAPLRMAYLRRVGAYEAQALQDFWAVDVARWMVASGLHTATRLGLCLDDPSITAPELCRYDAGIMVDAEYRPSHGAHVATLPGGRYAVHRINPARQDAAEAWCELMRVWLPASGWQLDGRPCFELYPPTPAGAEPGCELHIPVAPL